MKIRVEVSPNEIRSLGVDDANELKELLIEQLDDGVVEAYGEESSDWLPPYSIEVVVVAER